jgi:hypothetical protein
MTRRAVALLLGLMISIEVQAQPTTRNTTPLAYSHKAFSGVLTPHFQGNDLKKIVDNLAARDKVVKGEFETSDQYATRREELDRAPLSDGIARNGTLALVFQTEHSMRTRLHETPQLSIDYDADAATMTVRTLVQSVTAESGLWVATTIWDKASETVSFGIASNAYGAKAQVRYSAASNYGIAYPSRSRVDAEGEVQSPMEPVLIKFPLSPAKATLVKNRLRVLIVCTVRDTDPLFTTESHETATITDPYEWHDKYSYLQVRPSETWVFDSETGEVLAKSKYEYRIQR